MEAVIFDMDGVLVATEPLHAAAESLVLQSYGIRRAPAFLIEHYSGIPSRDTLKEIFHAEKRALPDLGALEEDKMKRLMEHARDIHIMPGVLPLLRGLQERQIPMGLATSSRQVFMHHVLSTLKLSPFFQACVSIDDVKHGKPAPDLFLLCADKLGVAPRDCVVIEDASAGIKAAKAAGMRCIGYKGDPKSRQDYSRADIVITSFLDIRVEDIEKLH